MMIGGLNSEALKECQNEGQRTALGWRSHLSRDGGGHGRAGASFLPNDPKNISRATPDPGEAASWERTTKCHLHRVTSR